LATKQRPEQSQCADLWFPAVTDQKRGSRGKSLTLFHALSLRPFPATTRSLICSSALLTCFVVMLIPPTSHPPPSPPVPPYLLQSALNLDQARPYPRILVASGPVLVGSLPYYRMSLDSWSGSRRARACGVTTSFADYIVVLLLLLSLPKPRFRNLGFGKLRSRRSTTM
jgi:hypothetical protein